MTAPANHEEQHTDLSVPQRIGNVVSSPVFFALFVALMFSWPIARSIRAAGNLPGPRPILGAVADFQLMDHRGDTFGSADLRGRLWIANFIFTRCPTICPTLTKQMAEIQHRIRSVAQVVHLVSFTVDPEYDTPEVLAEYAKRFRASQFMWSFVTGPRDKVQSLVRDGFKIYMEGSTDDPVNIGHGSHFVLVDGAQRIRGYYDLSDEKAMDELLRDVGLLINRSH